MTYRSRYSLVLAVSLSTRGYGFVLFEGPETPFYRDVKRIRRVDKNTRTIQQVTALIARYRPDAIVLEDANNPRPRRCPRIRRLSRALGKLAKREFVEVFRYSRAQVHEVFALAGASTKYEIAQTIVRLLPAFASRMPKRRVAWLPEDTRQCLFDAAALGLTFYSKSGMHRLFPT